MTEWEELIAAWILWLHSAHLSPATIETYLSIARGIRILADSPRHVTEEMLAAFVAAAPKTNSGAARRVVCRRLFAFAARTRRVDFDPAEFLPRVRRVMGLPRPASDADLMRADRSDARTDLMIELGSRLGLRCMEIAAAHSDDLICDLLGWSLRVTGKGQKVRTIPCPDDLAERIAGCKGWVFPSLRGGHLSARTVSRILSAALPGALTAHTLRHRYGTRTYQLGGRDIRAVQELLGHSSVATTQIYAAVEEEAKRRAAMAA